jgi:uncharacterized protein YxjI
MKPRLIIEQKITAFVNQYRIYSANEDGSKGQLVGFAQQKRLAFKEKIQFYTDESKQTLAFTLRAEKVLDVHGRYFVEDAAGAYIGAFKKEFTKSLVNSTWDVLGTADNVKLVISESSEFLAIMRRFGGMIPIVGGIIDLAVVFFKYHFVLTDPAANQIVGRYEKTTLIRDRYTLSMADAAYQAQDWRVLAAMSVALDALQSR